MSRDEPLISAESAGYLAQIVNRVAASFDVAALSIVEVVEVYVLFDRLMSALWREHKGLLLPFFLATIQRLGLPKDGLPEADEPEGPDGGSDGDPH